MGRRGVSNSASLTFAILGLLLMLHFQVLADDVEEPVEGRSCQPVAQPKLIFVEAAYVCCPVEQTFVLDFRSLWALSPTDGPICHQHCEASQQPPAACIRSTQVLIVTCGQACRAARRGMQARRIKQVFYQRWNPRCRSLPRSGRCRCRCPCRRIRATAGTASIPGRCR